MAAAKVIDDSHHNGRTVDQRLASASLLEEFQEAVARRDAVQMVALLEQVAITKPWATRLAAMILDGAVEPPIRLAIDDPRNAGVLRRTNEMKFPPCIRPMACPRDPYWHLG